MPSSPEKLPSGRRPGTRRSIGSPSFQAQGMVLRRLERTDYMMRQNTASSAGRVLRYGLLLLNGVVIAMRFLQWWQTSRNTDDVAGSLTTESLPVPPPPTPIAPHPNSRASTEGLEPGKCPVCRNTVTNAAVNIASGYVFCYPCLQQHAVQRGYCPVTHLHTTVQHIRRLYET